MTETCEAFSQAMHQAPDFTQSSCDARGTVSVVLEQEKQE